MLNLATPIEKLPRVGPKYFSFLKKLGIRTVKDLFWHFPVRYEDYSQLTPISEISEAGRVVSILGRVADIEISRSWRRRLAIVNATIEDGSGIIHAVWFNQPYVADTLKAGTPVSLSGKVSLDKKGLYLSSPSYEKVDSLETGNYKLATKLVHTGRLVPIYPETRGITSKYLRFLIKPLLASAESLTDPLPAELLQKYKFPKLAPALQAIHFPENLEQAKAARQRFAFEEILLFQLRVLRDRRQLRVLKAPRIEFDEPAVSAFVKQLPFMLTDDQRRAAFEILQDLGQPFPMNRLLNGDVGSGKTVVALIAAFQAAIRGYQAVFMAPTEILARQHFHTITRMLSGKPQIPIGLLTGSEARQFPADESRTRQGHAASPRGLVRDETENEKITKKLMAQKIAKGEISVLIGTHAVIQKDIKFKNLGLVVIDEQHRFGVSQRMKLVKNQVLIPHLLSMTATPIPRTLALTIYGDLDVSLLKEKPSGRRPIITRVISHSKRREAYRFIERQIKNGRQIFVVCPRIEISGSGRGRSVSQAKLLWSEVKAVTDEYEKLSKNIFPHRRVAMLHGKMRANEKNETMQKFKDGHYDILVSTSVVEVGVDIPNASAMMIESAERFGLAQLHQFRGRVGRAEHQSYCLLFTSPVRSRPAEGTATAALGRPTSNGTSSEMDGIDRRLRALEKIDNGFELAEADLKIRGPGEFAGIQQSGIPDIAMASLADLDLIKKARLEAKLLLKKDPTLKSHPLLSERLSEIQRLVHFE